ncbi:MAG: cation:proton antiporter [Nocardioides sp.]
MEIALLIVSLAVVVLAGAALADRLGLPPPILLLGVGIVASYLPVVPEVPLEPEFVLLGLLPPLLYAAALDTSLVDFNANRRAILLLSVGLVAFTALGVAVVVRALIGVSWPVAIAIGAVIAPPDAVAATAIGRRIGLPRRLLTVLEGESLLNDATALVLLRTAVAATAGAVSAVEVAGDFALAAGGGVAVGFGVFGCVGWVRRRVEDTQLDTGVAVVTPFAAYLCAEAVHASGVLAVVVAGLLLGHRAPRFQSASARITEQTTWRTARFMLENAVFLLIGLQASSLLRDLGDSELPAGRIAAVCAASLAAIIVLRFLWVFPVRYLLIRPGPDPATGRPAPWSYTAVVGWAGMRGVVTLAAAFVLPSDTPHRDTLLLIAFTAVAGTLCLNGLSLPWLARRLGVPGPNAMADALARADLLEQASRAGLAELDRLEYDDPHGVADDLRRRIEERSYAAWERLGTAGDAEPPSDLNARLRRAMLAAERERVLAIRSRGEVPAPVVDEVLTLLDVEEASIDIAMRSRAEVEWSESATVLRREECAELRAHPYRDAVSPDRCDRCLTEGTTWVALRRCLDCGNVACCDSSPGRHATAHFDESGHPVMASAEPGERWRWCYAHRIIG